MKDANSIKNLKLIENLLFYLFLLGNLVPLFYSYYVGSLDGPKHLQIANIIKELLSGNELFAKYFELSPIYTANLFGNYFIALLRFIFPAWLSEKILLSFYVILLATGFRYLIYSITEKPNLSYFLIFPFTYTSLFLMGYYNYSIAFGFFFYTVGYYIRNYNNMNILTVCKFMILILLTYYSHFFVYIFLLGVLGALTLNAILFEYKRKGVFELKALVNRISKVILAFSPSLILSFLYLRLILKQPVSEEGNLINRLADLSELRILIGFVHTEELPMTRFLFLTLLALVVFTLIVLISKYFVKRNNNPNENTFNNEKLVWSFFVVFFFGLYFLMPNNLNASGNILPRILIFAIYFLLVWLSLTRTPFWINIFIVAAILYYGITNYPIHVKYRQQFDKLIMEIKTIEQELPANCILLSKNYMDNWVMYHFQTYIGTDKPILNLYSQSISPLFAINWSEARPLSFVGAKYAHDFTEVYNLPDAKGTFFSEYIAILGKSEFDNLPETNELKTLLLRDYKVRSDIQNSLLTLYQLDIMDDIEFIMDSITKDQPYFEKLKHKALSTGLALEDVKLREAIWLYDSNK
ncbi:MAG: hypothetical protein CVT92_14755 [Bacteroidetes bacterium HGW-Bacteroidetes-1]|jgi:hypothetical protein|nr:MAG: hypothetical protein CVT92_14755 [Bacteroidetes bacterium HGW-Bacteroidetes-1]